MSRWKIISLVLLIGLGLGMLVPLATAWWYERDQAGMALNAGKAETMAASASLTMAANQDTAKVTYHFGLERGVLSVIEGKPGTKGKVILSGLSAAAWPKEILEMAPKVEFNSLDEVQSFIDTVNEPLWQE